MIDDVIHDITNAIDDHRADGLDVQAVVVGPGLFFLLRSVLVSQQIAGVELHVLRELGGDWVISSRRRGTLYLKSLKVAATEWTLRSVDALDVSEAVIRDLAQSLVGLYQTTPPEQITPRQVHALMAASLGLTYEQVTELPARVIEQVMEQVRYVARQWELTART